MTIKFLYFQMDYAAATVIQFPPIYELLASSTFNYLATRVAATSVVMPVKCWMGLYLPLRPCTSAGEISFASRHLDLLDLPPPQQERIVILKHSPLISKKWPVGWKRGGTDYNSLLKRKTALRRS